MQLWVALGLGFLLGLRHATDVDHVVAVSTLVGRSVRVRDALRTGALWGLGHSLTVVGVGAAMVWLGLTVSDRAARAMELLVGAMLVALGALAVASHGGCPRGRRAAWLRALAASRLRPLVVGMVHGLAGSAALTLLALTTIRDKAAALVYLGLFGVGTVLGMLLITLLLALPFLVRPAGERVQRAIALGSGLLSVAVGLGILGALVR